MTTPPPPVRKFVVGDAGVVIGFVAANRERLLCSILQGKHLELKIPYHVDGEIQRVLKRKTTALQNAIGSPQAPVQYARSWTWLKGQFGATVVLAKVEIGVVGDPVADKFGTLVDVVGLVVTARMQDGGELFVIAHGLHYQDTGEAVAVAIDDAGGRKIASGNNLEVITSVDLFEYAIELGLFANEDDLRDCYDAVREHSKMPEFNNTRLSAHFNAR